jgi:hypothetical protein
MLCICVHEYKQEGFDLGHWGREVDKQKLEKNEKRKIKKSEMRK